MPNDLKYLTTCQAKTKDGQPCGQRFQDHPLNIPIIGEPPDARTQRFVEALGRHIYAKHPDHGAVVQNLGMQFTGYLITKTYETEDPGLLSIQNALRYHIHHMTRRIWITDEQLQDTVARLDEEGFTAEKVLAALKEFREILTETGKAKPAGVSEPASILTP